MGRNYIHELVLISTMQWHERFIFLTMLDPTTFNQVITQAIHCDNHIFEHHQEKRWEPSPI